MKAGGSWDPPRSSQNHSLEGYTAGASSILLAYRVKAAAAFPAHAPGLP